MSDRLVFALFLGLPLLVNWRLRQPLFRPCGLMAAVWCAALLGAEAFAPDFVFSERAGWTILAFVGSFAAGDWITARRVGRPLSRLFPLSRIRTATIACGVLSLAGAVWCLVAFAGHFGGFEDFFSAGWAVRAAFAGGEVSLPFAVRALTMLGYSGVVLALAAWSAVRFRLWMALPFLGVVVFGLSQFGRAGLVIVAVEAFLMSYYRDIAAAAPRSDRRFVFRLLPAAGVIAAIFLGGELIKSGLGVEDGGRSFAVYALSGPSALSDYLHSAHIGQEPAWGLQSFDSLAAALGLKQQTVGVYDSFAQLSARETDAGNIFTAIRPLTEDFGLLGACVAMFLTGALSGLAFESMRRGSLAGRALSCALGAFVVFTVFYPLTYFNGWLLSLALPPLVLIRNVQGPAPDFHEIGPVVDKLDRSTLPVGRSDGSRVELERRAPRDRA